MGCSQSEDGPGEVKIEDNSKLPDPEGEKVWFVFGPSVVICTWIKGDIAVKDVVGFLNWKLDENKAKLPEGYNANAINISGLTSADAVEEGLMFSPEDTITGLDCWEEGERHLVAVGSEWKIVKYLEDEELMTNFKDPAYWKAMAVLDDGLHILWNTDLRVDDVPKAFIDAAESAADNPVDV